MWELALELPAWNIDPGVEEFEGVRERKARAALVQVELDTRQTFSLMVDKRVTRVVTGCELGEGAWARPSRARRLRRGGELYTLFGILEGRSTISCEGDGFDWKLL